MAVSRLPANLSDRRIGERANDAVWFTFCARIAVIGWCRFFSQLHGAAHLSWMVAWKGSNRHSVEIFRGVFWNLQIRHLQSVVHRLRVASHPSIQPNPIQPLLNSGLEALIFTVGFKIVSDSHILAICFAFVTSSPGDSLQLFACKLS